MKEDIKSIIASLIFKHGLVRVLEHIGYQVPQFENQLNELAEEVQRKAEYLYKK